MVPSHDSPQTLVDDLLLKQRDLTAVARFARWHATEASPPSQPAMARHYRALLPLTAPSAGQQYGFEVDLDSCSGCKACVTACHALNGLEEHETWRRVGLLIGGIQKAPDSQVSSKKTHVELERNGTPNSLLQHVTTACHHCLEAGCLHGCPVLAYDKDPVTGIVRHLDDQCIGCTYCMMMCPYEVPQYSERLGIVRKCDMCHGRLAAGEAPACVQACPTEAIRIRLVETADVRRLYQQSPANNDSEQNAFLPATPEPGLTLPTTRYLTRRSHLTGVRAADEDQVAPAHVHHSLVGFLLLSQLSVGLATTAAFHSTISGFSAPRAWITAWLIQCLALGVAFLHLGQPLRAWRSFLGWRTSWFSREVIAFGLYTTVLGVTAAANTLSGYSTTLALLTALIGQTAVFCSAMIYAATGRRFWAPIPTTLRFHATTAALGAPTLLLLLESATSSQTTLLSAISVAGLIAILLSEKLAEDGVLSLRRGGGRSLLSAFSRAQTVSGARDKPRELRRTSRLLQTILADQYRWHWVASFIALLCLLAVATGAPRAVTLSALAIAATAACLERQMFFSAVAPDRMPGGVVT